MKIILSKSQWEKIGEKKGWFGTVKTAEPDGLTGGQTGVWQDQLSRLMQEMIQQEKNLRGKSNYRERQQLVWGLNSTVEKISKMLAEHGNNLSKALNVGYEPMPENVKLNPPG